MEAADDKLVVDEERTLLPSPLAWFRNKSEMVQMIMPWCM